MKVSIITPLFSGKKYLLALKRMIEIAAIKVDGILSVEWVISNDDPTENINETSDVVEIIVLNTNINHGIQGARVIGLNASSGDYILFLDQDDIIYPRWIVSQYEKIREIGADAVVCDAIYDGKHMYGVGCVKPALKEAISREYNIGIHIGFTVGQTLIKRDCIPQSWINNWLKTNCCDDHFLWICMFGEHRRFICNDEILYEHIKTGHNQSENSYVWAKSTHEMMDIVKREQILESEDEVLFVKSREKHIEEVVKSLDERKYEADVFRKILSSEINNGFKLLESIKAENVAIYGYRTGILIVPFLRSNGVNVECIIDRDADFIKSDIPLFNIENTPLTTTCVIETLLNKDNKKIINRYYKNNRPSVKVLDIISCFEEIDYLNENGR